MPGRRLWLGETIQRADGTSLSRRTSVFRRAWLATNVYGPIGSFEGGREKAPAALCRKIAVPHASAKDSYLPACRISQCWEPVLCSPRLGITKSCRLPGSTAVFVRGISER